MTPLQQKLIGKLPVKLQRIVSNVSSGGSSSTNTTQVKTMTVTRQPEAGIDPHPEIITSGLKEYVASTQPVTPTPKLSDKTIAESKLQLSPLTEISKTGISMTPETFRRLENLGIKLNIEHTAPIYAAGGLAIAVAAAVYGGGPLMAKMSAAIGATSLGADTTAMATTKIISKTISKGGIKDILIGGAGLLTGALLFGGGNEQTVQPTQITTADPTQETELDQTQDLSQTVRDLFAAFKSGQSAGTETTPTFSTGGSTYDIAGGEGNIDIPSYNLQETYTTTYQGLTQEQIGTLSQMLQGATQAPVQLTIQTPTQETTATQQNTNWLMVAAIAAAGIIGMMLFKKEN
jgi:hypothetical protein